MTIRLLQDYVTRQADRRPDATAVLLRDGRLSYGELEERSNRLARLMKEGGCEAGDRIGLLLPKSPTAVGAMLGVLKADCVYVPVDPESPAARVEKILRAADCRYVLGSTPALPLLNGLMPQFDGGAGPGVVWMERGLPAGAEFDLALTEADAEGLAAGPLSYTHRGDAPAHILFTSGSTGVPKGVIVSHANVVAFVSWAKDYFGLGPDDRVSCHSPFHFDLSTFDLYGAFAAGAEVHLATSELNLFPGRLVDFIRGHRLTQWFSVPSVLAYLARFDAIAQGDFPELKRILWCGEVFSTPALKYWMERVPHASFTNLYGPTEATIASSYHTVTAAPVDLNASVPIGRACGGEELLVLGEDLKPLRPGEVGELYIGGAGVTSGYWRDPDKTRRAFLPGEGASQFADGRIYRTGDLGYRDAEGIVHFLGRADLQIKSRGHRIELGEIEAALHTIPEVGQGAVVAIESPEFGGYAICCAYVARPASDVGPKQLRERLGALVPKYMLPARWRRMDDLPANANGKVDRVALKAMFQEEMASDVGRTASDQ